MSLYNRVFNSWFEKPEPGIYVLISGDDSAKLVMSIAETCHVGDQKVVFKYYKEGEFPSKDDLVEMRKMTGDGKRVFVSLTIGSFDTSFMDLEDDRQFRFAGYDVLDAAIQASNENNLTSGPRLIIDYSGVIFSRKNALGLPEGIVFKSRQVIDGLNVRQIGLLQTNLLFYKHA